MHAPHVHILLIEPDRARADALAAALRACGIIVATRHGEGEIDALVAPARWLRRLDRTVGAALPIVVIDGPRDPASRAALLDAGAADVLARPADPAELAARLRALVRLRRMPPIACADLSVDLVSRHATRAGRALPLHPREFSLLGHLARHCDRPVDRLALLRAVWRRGFDPGTNVVAVNVSRLRAKVDHGFASPLIHTVGSGYMLSAVAAG
ncbi:MAG TPA: winged helix-turn-helix domain-containing protein [Sphingomonas sp.]